MNNIHMKKDDNGGKVYDHSSDTGRRDAGCHFVQEDTEDRRKRAGGACTGGHPFSGPGWCLSANGLVRCADRWHGSAGLGHLSVCLWQYLCGDTGTASVRWKPLWGRWKAKFGKSPWALVICVILALVIAGSLLGDAIASTVIGVLTVGTLAAMGLSPEHICCIIVMGASMGSIMPPITQALALSSTLVNTDSGAGCPDRLCHCTARHRHRMSVCGDLLREKKGMKIVEFDENGEEITDERKAGQILRENWHSLIPLGVLILIVLFRTINVEGLKFDLVPELLGKIQVLKIGEESISLYSWLLPGDDPEGTVQWYRSFTDFRDNCFFFFKKVRRT